jgi:4a-hydroxytetrahydrobiopterin dehydratase
MPRLLNDDEVLRQLQGLPDWHRRSEEPRPIAARFTLGDFADAMIFVNQVAAEAEEMDHHPDIDIRWNTVELALCTHSAGGLTQLDMELAHRISALPRPAGTGESQG